MLTTQYYWQIENRNYKNLLMWWLKKVQEKDLKSTEEIICDVVREEPDQRCCSGASRSIYISYIAKPDEETKI